MSTRGAPVTRLTLVSHAMTGAMRAARFPLDEPVDDRAGAAVGTTALRADRILIGPERRAAQTAAVLGLPGTVDPALRDLDCGEWAGRPMGDLDPLELMSWMSDPDFRGHGGESVTEVIERVRQFLDTVADRHERIVAVTHPAIVRASILVALAAPPESFWRIDIPPCSVTTLHCRGPGWTLRHTAQPL